MNIIIISIENSLSRDKQTSIKKSKRPERRNNIYLFIYQEYETFICLLFNFKVENKYFPIRKIRKGKKIFSLRCVNN